MVVLILTFLRISFHIFDINRNLAKLKLGRMAFYNDVPILHQTCSYFEVLVNQKQKFTDIAIIS